MILKIVRAVAIVLRIGPEKILKLEKEAITDPLTGLLNRRGLEERLKEELKRFERYKRPFLIAFIDLDDLKTVNDLYGHQRGDQVIVSLAETIKRSCRAVDFSARVGGDEFIIVFTETTDRTIVQRLRQGNVSIGYSCYEGSKSLEETIAEAETMMRQEKKLKNGRGV